MIDSMWFSEIPKDWKMIPLKHLVTCDNSGVWGEDPGMLEVDLPVSTTAHIDKFGNINFEKMPIRSISLSDFKKFVCVKGDIIVVKSSGSASNIITGKCALVGDNSRPFAFSNFLLRLRPNDLVDPRYLYGVLSSDITVQRIKRMVSATTYPNLKVEEYLESVIPVPPIEEQRRIANYLVARIANIDLLVSMRRTQMAVNDELVASILAEHIDPSFEQRRLKYIANISVSNVDKHSLEDEASVFLCNYLDVYRNRYITNDIEFMPSTASKDQIRNFTLRRGDVTYTKDSETADDIAVCAYVSEEIPNLVLGYHCGILRAFDVDSEYLYWAIQSPFVKNQFCIASTGVTRVGLKLFDTGDVRIPLASLSEQSRIVDAIKSEVASIERFNTVASKQIDAILELRTSIITETISGTYDISTGLGAA